MLSGDMPPPPRESLGAAGPRGPCCIPFNMSSKPMVFSCYLPSTRQPIAAISRLQGWTNRAQCRDNATAPRPFPAISIRRASELIMTANRPIGIAGAGSIGCFVGGILAQAGSRVALLARPRVIEEIERNGLRVTSFEGLDRKLSASDLSVSDDP